MIKEEGREHRWKGGGIARKETKGMERKKERRRTREKQRKKKNYLKASVGLSSYVLSYTAMCPCSHSLNSSRRPEGLEIHGVRSTSILGAAALAMNLRRCPAPPFPQAVDGLSVPPFPRAPVGCPRCPSQEPCTSGS